MRKLILCSFVFASTSALGAPCDGAKGSSHKNPDGSQGGFVANSAKVSGTVFLDASSSVCEQARVQGNAKVKSSSMVGGTATVEGNSEIISSRVYGASKVYGKALVVNSAVCQASDINFKVSGSDYYCQSDDPEPKHPGEMGKKTLMGIDSDSDGVRDDIEIWINNTTSNLKNRDMYNLRVALKRIAIKIQKNMASKDSPAESLRLMLDTFDSVDCLKDLSKSREEYKTFSQNIKFEFFNTEERIKADFKMRSHLAGYSGTIQDREKNSTCDFKLR